MPARVPDATQAPAVNFVPIVPAQREVSVSDTEGESEEEREEEIGEDEDIFDAVERIVEAKRVQIQDEVAMAAMIGFDVTNQITTPISNEHRDQLAVAIGQTVLEKWQTGSRLSPHHAAISDYSPVDEFADLTDRALPAAPAEEMKLGSGYQPELVQNKPQKMTMTKGLSDRRKLRGRAKHESWHEFVARTGKGKHDIRVRAKGETWHFTASEIRVHNNIYQGPSPHVMDKVPVSLTLDSLG